MTKKQDVSALQPQKHSKTPVSSASEAIAPVDVSDPSSRLHLENAPPTWTIIEVVPVEDGLLGHQCSEIGAGHRIHAVLFRHRDGTRGFRTALYNSDQRFAFWGHYDLTLLEAAKDVVLRSGARRTPTEEIIGA